MTHELQPDPSLERLHQDGVACLKENPLYSEAVLQGIKENIDSHYVDRKAAATLHAARITRDIANATLRRAVHHYHTDVLQSEELLGQSSDAFDLSAASLKVVAEESQAFSESAQSYVFSEYGATISFQGRQNVAEKVLFDRPGTANAAMGHFSHAAATLHSGDNGYYKVGNALHAARFEAWRENKKELTEWMHQGNMALRHTIIHDPCNARRAALTYGRLWKDIRGGKPNIYESITVGGV
jgi:hypothetical protein